MIRQLGSVCARIFQATCPDPFVIAILLTVVTAGLALLFGRFPQDASPVEVVFDSWRNPNQGLWKLLSFSMQMCLILVTGHALASNRPVQRAIAALAERPRTPAQAVALVASAAAGTAVINWGLGLIVGAIMARDVGRACHRRNIRVHYPLLVAAGYIGLMVWHGGLSGSAPLSVTSPVEAAKALPEQAIHYLGPSGIPLGRTLFSPMNLVITGGLLLGVPLFFTLLTPRDEREIRTIDTFPGAARPPMASAEPAAGEVSSRGIPEFLDRSPVVSLILAGALLLAVGKYAWTDRTSDATVLTRLFEGLQYFGLNEINMTMLAAGLILHGSPRSYMAAVEEGARGCAGIIIQFPLYAGIMAIMLGSGLAAVIADAFVNHASATTLPFFSYFAACVINLFIPSGGGQWAVQGPIALSAGAQLGVDPAKMVMSVAYGDQLTNMLQPFWALPLLSITGVKARDFVGYTAVVMVASGIWIGFWMLIF